MSGEPSRIPHLQARAQILGAAAALHRIDQNLEREPGQIDGHEHRLDVPHPAPREYRAQDVSAALGASVTVAPGALSAEPRRVVGAGAVPGPQGARDALERTVGRRRSGRLVNAAWISAAVQPGKAALAGTVR